MKTVCFILILLLVIFAGNVSADEPLNEGFNDAFPPPGWQMRVNNPEHTWNQTELAVYEQYSVAPWEGTYFLWCDYDMDDPSDEWIITPPVDITDYEDVELNFAMWGGSEFIDNANTTVLASTNYGDEEADAAWEVLWTWPPIGDDYQNYQWFDVNLDACEYSGEVVWFAFRYSGFYGEPMGLDNVRVIALGEYEPDDDVDDDTPDDDTPDNNDDTGADGDDDETDDDAADKTDDDSVLQSEEESNDGGGCEGI